MPPSIKVVSLEHCVSTESMRALRRQRTHISADSSPMSITSDRDTLRLMHVRGGKSLAAAALALAACGKSGGSLDGGGDGGDARPDSGGEMIVIPAATFMMGCNDAVETVCTTDERPYHSVSLASYEIDRTEVTQGAYGDCVTANACLAIGGNDPAGTPLLPVVYAHWSLASTYCAWTQKRLPTEAEWEYAARGNDGRRFPWGNGEPDCTLANMGGCGGAPQPVDTHPAGQSPFGAADMAGNQSEWVADWYDAGYYAVSPAADPTGPAIGTQRIQRGGNFGGGSFSLRVANRQELGPDSAVSYAGFRCAR